MNASAAIGKPFIKPSKLLCTQDMFRVLWRERWMPEANQLFDGWISKEKSTILHDHDWLFYRQNHHLAERSWCICYYYESLIIIADIAVLSGIAHVKCFCNNKSQPNFSCLMTGDGAFWVPSYLPSEVPISRGEILIVYKNTFAAAPLESIIRHRNLDTRGIFQPFEVKPLWDGKK